MGFGASTTVGNVSVDLVQADVAAIIAGIANGKTLADLHTGLVSGLPACGTDAAGQDAYATVVTAPARTCHNVHVAVGDNGVIISLDGGATDHFAIPANTERLFSGLLVASEAEIQARNLSPGNDYTNCFVSVW